MRLRGYLLLTASISASSVVDFLAPRFDARNIAMLESAGEKAVNSWIHRVISQGTYRDFDDLHIDRISPDFSVPENWLSGSVECLTFAQSILRREHPAFKAAVGFSLRSGPEPIGLVLSSDGDLESEYLCIPPSLYIFRVDDLPWKRTESGFVNLNGLGGVHDAGIDFFYLEYREDSEPEYRRSLWITPQG